MALEIIPIIVIVLLQLWFFGKVLDRILKLEKTFHGTEESMLIKSVLLPPSIYKGRAELSRFLGELKKQTDVDGVNGTTVELVHVFEERSVILRKIILSINSYLVRNRGVQPSFSILRDIAERKIEVEDEAINNQIAVPLYIGLAGTFLGIVLGLWGMDFQNSEGGAEAVFSLATEDIQTLISGVRLAMIASFLGLILTVINQAYFYKRMAFELSQGKNDFYDFLQQELLPRMGSGLADTLSDFKDYLEGFNVKFGGNLKSYERSFELINENLSKQGEFLAKVEEVGVVNLSKEIVTTFEKVDLAAQSFEAFLGYQEKLNGNLSAANQLVSKYQGVFEKFASFNENLEKVAAQIDESNDFYQQFKEFLSENFTALELRKEMFTSAVNTLDEEIRSKMETIGKRTLEQSEQYDEQWRKMTDTLSQDIATVFQALVGLIEEESESLAQYVQTQEQGLTSALSAHSDAFASVAEVKPLFEALKSGLLVNHEHFEQFHEELTTMAKFLKENSLDLKELRKEVLELRGSSEDVA